MIVLIAGIVGISDVAALVALFAVNASMILFGWLMETSNQLLQYRRNGRWHDYLHGERVYMALSLIAKSALAWQIFVNVLI